MNGMIVSIICPLYKGGKYVNNIVKKSIVTFVNLRCQYYGKCIRKNISEGESND